MKTQQGQCHAPSPTLCRNISWACTIPQLEDPVILDLSDLSTNWLKLVLGERGLPRIRPCRHQGMPPQSQWPQRPLCSWVTPGAGPARGSQEGKREWDWGQQPGRGPGQVFAGSACRSWEGSCPRLPACSRWAGKPRPRTQGRSLPDRWLPSISDTARGMGAHWHSGQHSFTRWFEDISVYFCMGV